MQVHEELRASFDSVKTTPYKRRIRATATDRVPVSDTVNRAPSVAQLAERPMILLPSAGVPEPTIAATCILPQCQSANGSRSHSDNNTS